MKTNYVTFSFVAGFYLLGAISTPDLFSVWCRYDALGTQTGYVYIAAGVCTNKLLFSAYVRLRLILSQ